MSDTPKIQRLMADYRRLAAEAAEWQKATDDTKHKMAQVLARLHKEGLSLAEIGQRVGYSKAWVQQLVEKGQQ